VVDSPTSIVLLGNNRNRVGSMVRCRCRRSYMRREGARIGALIGIVASFFTSIAPLFSQRWVLSCLGPLNILISSSRGLEIVGALNHLVLHSRKSLSS
jgi:hypothetical protein